MVFPAVVIRYQGNPEFSMSEPSDRSFSRSTWDSDDRKSRGLKVAHLRCTDAWRLSRRHSAASWRFSSIERTRLARTGTQCYAAAVRFAENRRMKV